MSPRTLHVVRAYCVGDGYDETRLRVASGATEAVATLTRSAPDSTAALLDDLCAQLGLALASDRAAFAWDWTADGRVRLTAAFPWRPVPATPDGASATENQLWEWLGFSCARAWSDAAAQEGSHPPAAVLAHDAWEVSFPESFAVVERAQSIGGGLVETGWGGGTRARLDARRLPAAALPHVERFFLLAAALEPVAEGDARLVEYDGKQRVAAWTLDPDDPAPSLSWSADGRCFDLSVSLTTA